MRSRGDARQEGPGGPCPSVRRHLVTLGVGVRGLGEGRALVGLCALDAAAAGVPGIRRGGVAGELVGGEERHVRPQAVSLQSPQRQRDLRNKQTEHQKYTFT